MTDGWFQYLHSKCINFNRSGANIDSVSFVRDYGGGTFREVPPSCNRPPLELNTLEDCLKCFSFPMLLKELEDSLDKVRKRKKSIKEHEDYVKQVDKKMQKLSMKYHPDKVKNRAGSSDELTKAEKLHTALNSTRTVIKILSEKFLEDLDIDHKYKFYAKLDITSLGNEEQIKKQISDVLYKTVLLSEIKQVNIIAQIRKFLTESQISLNEFSEKNVVEFKKHRNYALYHLKKCIDGYEKLLAEFKAIDEECKSEKLVHIASVIKEMADKSSEEFATLKKLESVTKCSLEKKFQIFSSSEHMDDYLILPFVYYVNVLLMCSLVFEENHRSSMNFTSLWNSSIQYIPLDVVSEDEFLLNEAAKLAFMLDDEYQEKVRRTSEKRKVHKEKIKSILKNFLESLRGVLEKRFNIEAYVEGGNEKYLSQQCAKCMKMANDIDNIALNISREMQKCQREEKAKESYENFMKGTYEFEKEIAESLEQSKLFQDEISKVIQNKNQEYIEKDEISLKQMGEIDKEIEESLKRSKFLEGKVLKLIQKGEDINVDYMDILKRKNEFRNEISESIEKREHPQEEVSPLNQNKDKRNKAEDENYVDITNEFEKEIAENVEQSKLFQDEVSKVIQNKNHEYIEKDERGLKQIGEIDKEIEESLKRSKLLEGKVLKLIQKDEDIKVDYMEILTRKKEFRNEISGSIEKREHTQEEVSPLNQNKDKRNKAEDENYADITNKFQDEIMESQEQDKPRKEEII